MSLQIGAFDVRGRTLTYTATGLPSGLAIDRTSGIISGTPVTRSHSQAKVTVSDGSAITTIDFEWTIKH